MKKPYKKAKTICSLTTKMSFKKINRYKNHPYEKISFSHLGQNLNKSPAQTKARDVIRKYRLQIRKLEFKRLKKLVPSMQNTSDEESNEVINYFLHCNFVDKS